MTTDNSKVKEGMIPVQSSSSTYGYSQIFYYRSNNWDLVQINRDCSCGKFNFFQEWIPKTFLCSNCEKIKKLENDKKITDLKIKEMKEQLELAKVNHEDFIEKSKNWHDQQLAQKDEEIDNLNKKMKSLEEKFSQLESKYSELITKES